MEADGVLVRQSRILFFSMGASRTACQQLLPTDEHLLTAVIAAEGD